jgi:hypothetical protein
MWTRYAGGSCFFFGASGVSLSSGLMTDDAGGHLGVACCGVELGMSKQNLDHTNIDVLLEQVRGEAVPPMSLTT